MNSNNPESYMTVFNYDLWPYWPVWDFWFFPKYWITPYETFDDEQDRKITRMIFFCVLCIVLFLCLC